jgi:microcystin degradation protein MlrC
MPHAHRSSLTIAIGGISHETHAFSPAPTTLADFEQRAMLTGTAMLAAARGSDGVLGGIVDAAGKSGVELIPTLFASAMPAGPVEHETSEQLRLGLLTRLRTAAIREPGLDGVIVALHGAMATTEELDPDGALVETVRETVGEGVPIVVTLDSHGTPSDRLIAAASAILSYRTYPHVDTHATGAAALSVCRTLAQDPIQPRTAVRRLPVLLPLTAQRTNGPTPMARLMRQIAALSRLPGVLQTNLLPGFPYHDVPHAGATVTVTTDNDRDLAESIAGRYAEGAWQFLRTLGSTAIPLDDLVAPVIHTSGRPVVLADVSDNPGAGAPGDNTAILARALAEGWGPGIVATIRDPDTVAQAVAAGAGAIIDAAIGGRMPPWSGEPIAGRWEVRSLGEGVVRNVGPIGRGGASRYGRTAALRRNGVTVIVTSRRQPVLDPAIIEAHGIDRAAAHWIAVKSAVHLRAAFEPIAAEIVEVDTGGLATERLDTFAYHQVRRPIVPLDPTERVNETRMQVFKVRTHV